MGKLKRMKGRIAAALAVVVSIACMYLPTANAASLISTTTECSLKLTVPAGSAYHTDSEKPDIVAKLYRVAEVSDSRHFTMLDEYGVDIEELSKDEDTDWAAEALTAAEHLDGKDSTEVTLVNGTGTARNLQQGMYLVTMETVMSPEYEYNFTPYFISLPNNLYYATGLAQDDEWIYDAESEIKLEQKPRYGTLEIVKTLRSYNETLGEVSFVFQVEGEKDGKTYSNVAMINFNGTGTASATLDKIPAGMTVTVTEVYTGSSYELTEDSMESQDVTILADGTDGSPVSVDFANEYNDKLIGGYGVQNHFEYADGEWTWSNGSEAAE